MVEVKYVLVVGALGFPLEATRVPPVGGVISTSPQFKWRVVLFLPLLHTEVQGKKILKAMMCKHVDDLKLAGEKDTIVHILKQIETVFGQLKIDWNNFTNCGVRHTQDPKTKEVSLDQIAYAKNLRSISHPQGHPE